MGYSQNLAIDLALVVGRYRRRGSGEVVMGDRGSICIVDEGPDPSRSRIYLYTQRAGWLLPTFLQQALKSLAPFSSYHNRPDAMRVSHHVYVEMLQQEEGIPLRDRSFGISSGLVDNERPVLTAYVEKMTISLHDVEDRPTGRSWSFEEFLRVDLPTNHRALFLPSSNEEHRRLDQTERNRLQSPAMSSWRQ